MVSKTYDIRTILDLQANKYPTLFLDKVIECNPGFTSKCVKNFTFNEWFFPSHYQDDPNVPGFVLVESMVQSFLITFLSLPEFSGSRTNFIDIKSASFRRKIVPGDVMILNSELISFKRGLATGKTKATVENEIACSGEFIVSIPKIMSKYRPI